MQLLLVRHGQTRSNVEKLLDTERPGAPLDEAGHTQAAELPSRLAAEQVDGIYVSDLVRTQQTAAPLAADRAITPVVLPGLREIQAGVDEMSPDSTRYVASLTAWREDTSVRIPGGESGVEFLTRFDRAVLQVAQAGHASAVLVTHGAAMRVWTSARCSNLTHDFLRESTLSNTTVLRVHGDPRAGWQIRAWGDHLFSTA